MNQIFSKINWFFVLKWTALFPPVLIDFHLNKIICVLGRNIRFWFERDTKQIDYKIPSSYLEGKVDTEAEAICVCGSISRKTFH